MYTDKAAPFILEHDFTEHLLCVGRMLERQLTWPPTYPRGTPALGSQQ